jgi:pseudaminic acid biosynthesis-associated methylase
MVGSKEYETEQESFWAGDFGDKYIARNRDKKLISRNIAKFARILSRTRGIKSVIEYGSNIGLNLIAIHQLLPDAELSAVEINGKAINELKKLDYLREIHHLSVLDFRPQRQYDFVFTCGLLIHINPEKIEEVYAVLHNSSRRYILVSEYYNPVPVEVIYRGHRRKLFKRDFAGELLDMFSDLRLVDYGFIYHRDPTFPEDDGTWFLLSK